MKNLFLCVLTVFAFQISFSQKSIFIKGKAPSYKGERIKLCLYSDMITYREVKIAESIIDTTGKFTLTAPVKDISYARLYIGFANGDLYIEPGKSYDLFIDSAAGQMDERTNLMMKDYKLSMRFNNLQDTSINYLIYNFDKLFDDFTYEHFNDIYKKRNRTLIDSLMADVSGRFSPIRNTFFKDYINYRIASLVQAAFGMNRYKLCKKYILNKPLLLNNPEYMEFFNEMFSMSLYSGIQNFSFYELAEAINSNEGYFKITDMLGKDSLLRNEALRDLILIKGLGEIYNDNNIKPESVILLLEQISKQSKFEKHRIIASNMLWSLKRFEKGTVAPEFTLKDRSGNMISLSDFKGKYIFLMFWNTLCSKCLLEMDVMNKMTDKYNSNISFVNIATDLNITRYQHFIQSTAFSWQFLYFDRKFDILDDYAVKTIPFFILIDRKGNFFKYPAPAPSENLDGFFQKLLQDEKK